MKLIECYDITEGMMMPNAIMWIGNVLSWRSKRIIVGRAIIQIPLWKIWRYYLPYRQECWLRVSFVLMWDVLPGIGMPRHKIRFMRWYTPL